MSRSFVEKFNNCIAHRGPDGEGIRFFNLNPSSEPESWDVAFAHRRLSILDLSENGKQPMSYADGTLWITFNGEIYNYIEIRSELVSKGYRFQSESDTEVILAAYQEWGTPAFARFRGMWALLILDCRRKKIIACRDRLGIKPLYYHSSNSGYIAFASEIKQLLTLPDIQVVANKPVVKQYLLTGFERTDMTFFESIEPVLPGTFAVMDLGETRIKNFEPYWFPENIKPTVTNIDEAANIFRNEIDESVRIHLRSDVAVGCQLSGGLDSSSIFTLMQKHYTGESIHSFTIQFEGFEKDETGFVKRMLSNSKAAPHFTSPDPAVFYSDLEKFIWHHDEPVGSFAHYAGFVLAELIAQNNIKVVLNGQGGDEILGGYWQQYFTYLLGLGKSGKIGRLVSDFAGALGAKGNEQLVWQIPSMLKRFKARNQSLDFTKAFEQVPSLHFFNDYFALSQHARRVFEIRNLILPRLLKWDDRNLMAFGIEGRYPFLDHKVIEAALSFDTKVLFKNGWTKYPLRMAMQGSMPDEITRRKSKWGFETPQQQWLQTSLKPVLLDWMEEDKPLNNVIDHGNVKQMAERFWSKGKLEDAQSLLRLFLLDKWFKKFSVQV